MRGLGTAALNDLILHCHGKVAIDRPPRAIPGAGERQSPSLSKLGFLPHEPRQLGADALHLWLQGRFRVGA
jgi:hypothetical protein